MNPSQPLTNLSHPLREHLASRRLTLFLGGDLPAALTGLPSRAELAGGLAQRHGLPAGLSLAATAQRAMQGGGRFAFSDYLGRQLDPLGRPPQRLHQLIAQIPWQLIITTAYDSLLELAFQQAIAWASSRSGPTLLPQPCPPMSGRFGSGGACRCSIWSR